MIDHASNIRAPAVAGRFYEADADRLRADARRFTPDPPDDLALPQALHGALVPHAGWVCSGRIAGTVYRALAKRTAARTLVLLGAVHTVRLDGPALENADAWHTPIGLAQIDADLRRILAAIPGFASFDMAHQYEHSLEVQLPLILEAFGPDTKIVPCLIPPHPNAPDWGRAIGQTLAGQTHPILVIASSDLTHYGPNYNFTPQGAGRTGIDWAANVNDARLLQLIEQMDPDAIVHDTQQHHSACGGGAIAAMIAAVQQLGANHAVTLEHTNSARELAPLGHTDDNNAVGYAGVVFG
ncbi:MAG: AmmeMemoRadiSam system protein B [Planctomycetaceae bacterium]|nr:AmmeMemoRadiSam system protein B [Planctomycetaceae bacterium]